MNLGPRLSQVEFVKDRPQFQNAVRFGVVLVEVELA